MGANQVMSEYRSTVTEVLSEKGMNMNGDKIDPLRHYNVNTIHAL